MLPENASNKNVRWESTNTGVATVNNGKVTAVKAGSAAIKVITEDGNKTAECSVTVNAKVYPVTSVSLDKTSLTLTEGDASQLTATVLPENASNKRVKWSSDNSGVASVDQNGFVSGVSHGTTTIKVKTEDDGKMAECSVTVESKIIHVTSVSLSQTSVTRTEGFIAILRALIEPENATNKNVYWSSLDESIATVNQDGMVSAISPGTTSIRVTTEDGGKIADCVFTVNPKTYPVTSVSLNQSSMTLTEGDTSRLIATVCPDNATNKTLNWTSSDTAVATVVDGLVVAIKQGTAIITATSNDDNRFSASCSLLVREPFEFGAVDLGLPSGLKWANANVGAESIEESGDYYAWGEIETKADYSWDTYKWAKGYYNYLTKYCPATYQHWWENNGTADCKTVLDLDDDVARVKLGGGWRIPTYKEWQELKTQCTWVGATVNGVKGKKVIGPNGNSIFLPAAGRRLDKGLYLVGEYFWTGCYWSSTLHVLGPDHAEAIEFSISGQPSFDYVSREYGQSIRAVTY